MLHATHQHESHLVLAYCHYLLHTSPQQSHIVAVLLIHCYTQLVHMHVPVHAEDFSPHYQNNFVTASNPHPLACLLDCFLHTSKTMHPLVQCLLSKLAKPSNSPWHLVNTWTAQHLLAGCFCPAQMSTCPNANTISWLCLIQFTTSSPSISPNHKIVHGHANIMPADTKCACSHARAGNTTCCLLCAPICSNYSAHGMAPSCHGLVASMVARCQPCPPPRQPQ